MKKGMNVKTIATTPSLPETLHDLVNTSLSQTSQTLDYVIGMGKELLGFTVSADDIKQNFKQTDASLEDKIKLLNYLSAEVMQISREVLERL